LLVGAPHPFARVQVLFCPGGGIRSLEADSPGKGSDRCDVLFAVAGHSAYFALGRALTNLEGGILLSVLDGLVQLLGYLLSIEFVNDGSVVSEDFVELTGLGVLFLVVVMDEDGPQDVLIEPLHVVATGDLSLGNLSLLFGEAFVVMKELLTDSVTLVRRVNRHSIGEARTRLISFDCLLVFIFTAAKEQLAQNSNRTAKNYRREDNKSQTCGHDDTAVRNGARHADHQTKGDGASDQTRKGNEGQFTPLDASQRVVLLVTTGLEQANHSEGSARSSNNTDYHLSHDKLGAPLKVVVEEESQANVTEHKALRQQSHELENNHTALLPLGRKVVPGIVRLHNRGSQESYDSRQSDQLSEYIRAISESEDYRTLGHGRFSQRAHFFQ